MPGQILCHIDCASPYSYFAFLHLIRLRPLLSPHNITITFIPVFLGGINHATGNKPPSTLPARAKYLKHDLARACKHFGTGTLSSPPFFPMLSLLPQRVMLVIQRRFCAEVFERIYGRIWIAVFRRHVDLADRGNMRMVLLEDEEFRGGRGDVVEGVLEEAGTKENKAVLNENTRRAVEEFGAFGAPWMWVVGEGGKGEPVFGSDRWVYAWRLLGLGKREINKLEEEGRRFGIEESGKARL